LDFEEENGDLRDDDNNKSPFDYRTEQPFAKT
jgi:hypothetical protein